jgi:hypothetical protein
MEGTQPGPTCTAHRADPSSSPLYRALLLLPNELLVQILCELFIADILVLRRASRALNELVTACGPALVRFWVKNKMGTLHTRLFPPPRTNEAHLQYLCE